MRIGKCACYLFVVLLTLGSVNTAHAWSFSLDYFFIDNDADPTDVGGTAPSDTSVLFGDGFDNGNFNTNPDFPSIGYINVHGNPVESGGLVTFDAYQGDFGTSDLTGNLRYHSSAKVDMDLASNTVFSVVGTFGLTMPDPRGRYGIRLTDGGTAPGNDRVEMALRHTQSGNFRLSFRYSDWGIGDDVLIEQDALNAPGGAQWIAMGLIKGDAGLAAITAGYAFLDASGTMIGTPTYFASTHNIFNTESWTRAQFFGVQVVPEMETWAMMLAGMGLIGYWARRRRV